VKPATITALSWLVTLLTPIILILTALRLLLLPAFLQVEYRMPGFPADSYGFTQQERLEWSTYAWRYAVNRADISYLQQLRFADGSPLLNERELSHMQDVKLVVQPALAVYYFALVLLAGLWIYARRAGRKEAFQSGLSRGGWVTVGLIAGMALIALIGFWQFFSLFHAVFFQGDSWLFAYYDTLIRLFPLRFWQDVFAFAFGFALIAGVLLGLFARDRRSPPESGKV
jgi:integral membrane protein (TIGR01906 family)